MKRTIVFLSVLLLPLIGFSQTKPDFEHVMEKFVKYYNNAQADSICKLFDYKDIDKMWNTEMVNSLHKKYGKIISCKYIGMDYEDHVTVFKIVAEKLTFATSLTLDKKNIIGTFRFHTSSPNIDKLMKKS